MPSTLFLSRRLQTIISESQDNNTLTSQSHSHRHQPSMALSASFTPAALRAHHSFPPSFTSPKTSITFTNPRFPRQEGQSELSLFSYGQPANWRTNVSFFSTFLTGKGKGKNREAIKYELLEAIAPLDRGAEASPEDRERIDQIARELEAVNQVKETLKSSLLNGKWELLYTTSASVLGLQRPKIFRPNGNIYQAINADTLRAQNVETWPFYNQVTANLVPLNARRVAVKFDTFKIFSLIPIKAPGRGRGELEITYLDDEIRVSRGDKGNLFILKMVDPSYRVPVS